MKRRDFIKKVGTGSGALAGGAVGATAILGAPAVHAQEKTYEWKMVTTWPKNFPGLGTGAEFLADTITRMTNGRVKVRVYGAGELVPAFEAFGAVSQGTAQMGHGAAYYWKGKSEAAQFFAAVPFGLTAQEMNGWIYHGGGMELWKEIYADFNLVPTAAGNTGVQMGGWFNKEIKTIDDLKGLKMRIPGLGGEVLKRAGGTPVSLPGGEIFTSLESGAIDATEWVGPYNDKAFGLFKAAKYYYYPGFHEPGTTLESFINKDALEELPDHLQLIVLNACRVANQDMLAEFTNRNNQALQSLINEEGVVLKKFPDEVLAELRRLSEDVVADVAETDEMTRKVYESYKAFRAQAIDWHTVSEQAYLNARNPKGVV
ncbi:TRAP transporter substrate-binding protein [Ectothiorhodospiraceae bacterium WFHF3C12]|nr:TRAP transporter substrate-binding protein [Ectothiorhodospiraceae bacterium WFHF3C12]